MNKNPRVIAIIVAAKASAATASSNFSTLIALSLSIESSRGV